MAVIYRTGFDGVWTAGDYASAWSMFPTRRQGLEVLASSGKSVTVSAGTIWAFGGAWVNTATATVTMSAPSAGTRWDLIAMRLNYATKVASLVVVTNPTLDDPSIPSGANVGIGSLYDVPIALVQNAASSGTVGSIIPAFAPTAGGSSTRLVLNGVQSVSDSNYRSLSVMVDSSAYSDIDVVFTGHTFSLPTGAYRINGQLAYGSENDSTASGRRGGGLALNPSSNTWNSTSVPGTLKVIQYIPASTEEVMVTVEGQRYNLTANDKLMLFARQTANETLAVTSALYKSFLSIEKLS